MPMAMEVRPERWTEIWVLFDNGRYSIISGVYDGGGRRLGERWNGDSDSPLGFPNVSGHPVWHVVPRFLEIPILHGLLDEITKNPTQQVGNNPPDRIMQELRVRHSAQHETAHYQ